MNAKHFGPGEMSLTCCRLRIVSTEKFRASVIDSGVTCLGKRKKPAFNAPVCFQMRCGKLS